MHETKEARRVPLRLVLTCDDGGMASSEPLTATANDIAGTFGIPVTTIRWYAHKGWISRRGWELPDGKRARLRPMYDVRQVLAVRDRGGPELSDLPNKITA